MKIITSSDNKHIKNARKLQDKKYRNQTGLFFVEGQRSFAEALQNPELITEVFVQTDMVDQYWPYVNQFPQVKWFQLDSKLIKYISSTQTPQGIIAVLKKPVWNIQDYVKDEKSLLVYLDQIADPGNLGTIIRSCWALDVDALLLSPDCADVYNPKTVRSSMGGVINYPVFPNIDLLQLKELKAHNYELISTDISRGHEYYNHDFSRKTILVIGSEAQGVSDGVKEICTDYIKIPMNSSVDSLNAACACAIIIAEARKQRFGSFISTSSFANGT